MWSAQSYAPRRQSCRRLEVSTTTLDQGSADLRNSLSFCRRDRRHGRPGGPLHEKRPPPRMQELQRDHRATVPYFTVTLNFSLSVLPSALLAVSVYVVLALAYVWKHIFSEGWRRIPIGSSRTAVAFFTP